MIKFAQYLPIVFLVSNAFAEKANSGEDESSSSNQRDYGELQVLLDYEDRDQKLGHWSLGPITSATDRYFNFKDDRRSKTGINWLIEIAPQFQTHINGGAGSTSNNETNLIAQWSLVDRANPDRGNLMIWYQISATWGSQTTTEYQDGLGVLSPPNGGDTHPASSRDLFQHFAWEQRLLDNRFRFQVGKITTRVLMNLNRYASSDREDFFTPMLVNNPVVHYTARGGLGFFGEYSFDGWYVSGMIRDADADLSKKFIDFDSLSTGNWEYLGEIGLVPADVFGLGPGNYRMTVSYSDATGDEASGSPSSSSFSLSFDQDLGTRIGAFFRYAASEDTFRSFDRRIAMGMQLKKPLGFENDRIGVGYWWGSPTDSSLRSESGFDFYWKAQIAKFLELSAGAQVIFDPAYRPDKDTALSGQLRARFVF